MAERIPAWKRLGLKLKSEGDAPSPVATPEYLADVVVEQPKRKRSPDVEESTPIKKSKKLFKINDSAATSSTPAQSKAEERLRRKSVAFTPETKTEDGDSIKQLFNAWVAEQKKIDPLFFDGKEDQPALQTPEPSKVDEKIDTTLDEPERRVKRVKAAKPDEKTKAKKPKASKVVKSKPIDPALTYLKQFHTDKANWKFNKINQISILKNAFDTDLIPAEYSESLYGYIAGLKGAGRLHLRDRALAIRDKDTEDAEKGFPEKMADRARKQEEYEAALQEYISTMVAKDVSSRTGYDESILLGLNPDTAMKDRMAKRMRAERVLNLLATTPGDPTEYMPVKIPEKQVVQAVQAVQTERHVRMEDAPPQTTVRKEDAPPQKTVRKRNRRTAVFESDSSSSDDSSDSDSGTSDEENSDKEDGKSNSNTAENDTSSSGSSNSSKASDSDSESSSSDSSSEDSD